MEEPPADAQAHVDHLELAAAVAGRLDQVSTRRLVRHLRQCEACATEAYAWGIHLDDEGNLKKSQPSAIAGPHRILFPVGHAGYDMPTRRPKRSPAVWLAGILVITALGAALLLLPPADASRPLVAHDSSAPAAAGSTSLMAGMSPPIVAEVPSLSTDQEFPASVARAMVTAEVVTMPQFRVITPEEAKARLAGSLRTIPALTLARVELGPGAAVPLALPDIEVVRLVYQSPAGELLLLDEQRLPVSADLGDVGIAPGDTLIYSDTRGITVATWLASRTLRLSLAGQMDHEAIRQVMTGIR